MSISKDIANKHLNIAESILADAEKTKSLEAYRIAAFLMERTAWLHIAADTTEALSGFVKAWAMHNNVAVRAGLDGDSNDSR